MELQEKTVLVTGASSGIGAALVARLAPTNRTVITLARQSKDLEQLAAKYSNVVPWPCDLSDVEALNERLGEVIDLHPDLSVVINNAGIQQTSMLHDREFPLESIEREIAVNLAAPIRIIALTIRHLVERGLPAAYINVSSGLGLYPKSNAAVYSATKAGLINFTRALRHQLEGSQVTAHTAILPLVATPMTEGRGGRKISADRAAREIIAGVESGRREIYVGKARWMPLISRLSPSLMAAIMRRA